MLLLFGQGLLDPDGVHVHFREECPRVRFLHPREMRLGFIGRRARCPACTEMAERKTSRRLATASGVRRRV